MNTAEALKIVRVLVLLKRRAKKNGDNRMLLDALDRAAYEAGYELGFSLREPEAR